MVHYTKVHIFNLSNDEKEIQAARRPFAGVPEIAAKEIRTGRVQKRQESESERRDKKEKGSKKASKKSKNNCPF